MPPGPPDEPAPGLIEGILRRGQDATPAADDRVHNYQRNPFLGALYNLMQVR